MIAPAACPILPAKNLGATQRYYEALGFEILGTVIQGYMRMARGPWEVHFFEDPDHRPEACSAGVYLRGVDVDALFAEWSKAEPSRDGIPRLVEVDNKPWGMRECALIDPNGTLLRIGQPL